MRCHVSSQSVYHLFAFVENKNTNMAHVLFMLFMFVCVQWCPTHIVLCFRFVFLRLVYPMLPVSVDCQFLTAPSVFSNVYFALHNLDYSVCLLQRGHLNHLIIVPTMLQCNGFQTSNKITHSFFLSVDAVEHMFIVPLKTIIKPV